MSAHEFVCRHWLAVAGRQACGAQAAQEVLNELVAAYGEPHRAYHTLDHIAALLQLLDEHGSDASDPDALVLAILFHDVVYDPALPDNEAASADLAAARLATLGFSGKTIAKVCRLILATKHDRQVDAIADPDLALLLDFDLSILAAAPKEYRTYAQAIRREYALYPDDIYRPGRRWVLEAFLARDPLYLTPRLRLLWEAQARANLASEIAELR